MDKTPRDLTIGDRVMAFGVLGGPFEVVTVNSDVPRATVTMQDRSGCVLNATSFLWDKAYSISKSDTGLFGGYDQEKIENGKRLLAV